MSFVMWVVVVWSACDVVVLLGAVWLWLLDAYQSQRDPLEQMLALPCAPAPQMRDYP